MRREIKFNVKIGVVILAFSLLVTCVFAGAMLWFGTVPFQTDAGKGSVYLLSSTDYVKILQNGGNLQLEAGKLMGTADYNTNLLHKQLERLLPFALIFLSALFILSVCLWSVLKRIQRMQTIKIAEQVNAATTDFIMTSEPVLAASYKSLKQKFDDQLNDYKRLNSYLSHEQKNSIAILRTNMEFSRQTEYLPKLDDIADSIDDILTLSENADTSPMAVVDVSVICAEVYDAYHKTASNIVFDFEGNDDTEILAKGRWIYRAVANLLDNAIKYGQNKPILLSVRAMHNSVIVTVKDHGIGIEEIKQENIFNDRYRINELNKDGYGIGLSLVAHVCDLCGGFVTVESAPGKGSTFYLSFPQKLF